MKLQSIRIAATALALGSIAGAVHTLVDLGYAKYQGRIVGDGTTQWLGMRYAAPPLSQLRFAAPRDPPKAEGIQDASKFGNICLAQNPTDWSMKPNPRFTPGEDCLYLNVFAPSNASAEEKLPVMFFIQGGGFGSNSNANYNASDLARESKMIVVSINYRVGPYGFLQSKEVEEGGDSNVGMRDMIKALEWVRDNIDKFGGNANHVVLNGDSAGASSIVILLTSPLMQSANLFVGAISESASEPTLRTLSQGQEQYDCLLKETDCSNTTTSSLACLRSLNATALQTTNCWFNPHLDNDVIPRTTFDAFDKGEYLRVPTIFGSCTDEGTKNVPQTTDTLADYNAFLMNQCPSLSNSSLSMLDNMYVTNAPAPIFPNSGKLWRQTANAMGDFRAHCVDKFYQDAIVRDGGKTWTYRYGVRDPDLEAQGFGAYHTVELYAVWGPNNTDGNPPKSYLPGKGNEGIVKSVRGYWASFVWHLDPNKARVKGSPEWVERGEGGERIFFVTNGTRMGNIDQGEARRCGVLEPLMRALESVPAEGQVTELKMG